MFFVKNEKQINAEYYPAKKIHKKVGPLGLVNKTITHGFCTNQKPMGPYEPYGYFHKENPDGTWESTFYTF